MKLIQSINYKESEMSLSQDTAGFYWLNLANGTSIPYKELTAALKTFNTIAETWHEGFQTELPH